jgi:hypothetical protein
MVEVFKTDVQQSNRAEMLLALLGKQFPNYKMNIDLADCDKILRIENSMGDVVSDTIIEIVEMHRHAIEILCE